MLSKTQRKRIIAELEKVRIGVDLTPPDFPKWLDLPLREEYVKRFGWPLVGEGFDELVRLLAGLRVVAVCSGLAYYERLLQDAGINVIATDSEPLPKTWMPVEQGDLYEAMERHQDCDTVFCSWPYQGTFRRDFPPHVKRVILIGECYENGCCDYINKVVPVKTIKIPQWECFHDEIYVYEF